MQTPPAPQVWDVTLTCRIVLGQDAIKTLNRASRQVGFGAKYAISDTNENVSDCGGCSRNKRESNRERAGCCSNSVAQSAPMHVLLHHMCCSWCFVPLSCPLQPPGSCCRGQQLSPQRGMSQAAPRAGRGTAGARLVGMGLSLQPHFEHFTKAAAAPGAFGV